MPPRLLFFLLLLLTLSARAQLRDDFTDGNFTLSPAWGGDAASFQVTSAVLQSNGPATTSSQLYLSTPCTASTGTTWEFWANLRLATSSGNLADVWLMASSPDLKTGSPSGYFVRLGGLDDDISLFRRDSTRSPVVVIDGLNMTLNSATNNLVRVRVTRSTTNRWTLERDLSGGRNFVAEANTPVEATYQRSVAAGVLLLYSSANSRNFYFDDFVMSDLTPPLLARAAPASARQADLVFNETLDAASANTAANYRLAGGAAALAAQQSAQNPAVVRLTFGADFGGQNAVEARNVADAFGNVAAGPLMASFTALPVAPQVGELIISELLLDETPVVGLPPSEFVEIYNRSTTKVLSLRGVLLRKTGTQAQAVFADTARLLPGQYAVVCGSTRGPQFAGLGKVYGLVNFPALTNTDGQLTLRGADGRTLFEVAYSDAWYHDANKKNGGWSLEMKDLNNFCAGADNWTASRDPSGGTPGRANSVAAPNPDTTPPALLRAVALNPRLVRVYFAEKLDSAAAATLARYALAAPGPAIMRATPVGPDFRQLDLTLAADLTPSRPLTLTVGAATDCVGNAAGPQQSAAFALPEAAQAGDVVVNEILFNPRVGAVDFVELLNRSSKYISLKKWQLANIKPDGSADNSVISPDAPLVLAPGELLALTPSPAVVQAQYPTSSEASQLLAVAGFPTFPDDAGVVQLADSSGRIISDRFAFNKNLHLSLLATQEGVSLERIRAAGPSDGSNFHSAAGAVGYATPGRPNSQAQDAVGNGSELSLSPEVFTPDDDGQQDVTLLSYQLDQPGYVASVTVYDALGRLTRRLLRNQTLPTAGALPWDGVDERGQKAAVGYYVFHVELFRPSGGEKREYKKTVVLGARF